MKITHYLFCPIVDNSLEVENDRIQDYCSKNGLGFQKKLLKKKYPDILFRASVTFGSKLKKHFFKKKKNVVVSKCFKLAHLQEYAKKIIFPSENDERVQTDSTILEM